MKKTYYFIGLLLSLFSTSCIQDEALNVEAAIDGCKGANIDLVSINDIKKEIDIYVSAGTDISKQELIFDLPVGASIKSNTTQPNDNPPYYNFGTEKNRNFTVTSEDGSNKAEYSINIVTIKLPHLFSFDNLHSDDPYHIVYMSDANRKLQWASGNPGFKLTGMGNKNSDYPTFQVPDGKSGSCMKLETKDTGSFGLTVGMPIAAGNLFIGSFNLADAISKPLESTLLGFPFTEIPERMTGYFKFKAGKQQVDKNKQPIPGKDVFDIYAVMFEANEKDFNLNGGNSLTDSSIVLMARIDPKDVIETDEWTYFDLPFKSMNGKTIDKEKLSNGKYKLTIVLSSSRDGAFFKGAIGSTLHIDELEIVCNNK